MEIFIFLFIIVFIIIVVKLFRSSPEQTESSQIQSQAMGQYQQEGFDVLDFKIAGINYREGIDAYIGDFAGYLQEDIKNEYDPNAIAIYHSDGHHLGFIPADENADVRELNLQFPIPVTGTIEKIYDDSENREFFVGVVYIVIGSVTKR